MTPDQIKRLPQTFRDIVILDRSIEAHLQEPVIPFEAMTNALRGRRRLTREASVAVRPDSGGLA